MSTTITTPEIITTPIASEGQKNTIPVTNDQTQGLLSQQYGFPAVNFVSTALGGIAPSGKDMNGVLNLLSQHEYYHQIGGLWTFNQSVSGVIGGYAKGAVLWYIPDSGEGYPVISLINNNTYNFVTNPEYIDGTYWRNVLDYYAIDSEVVKLTGTQTITGTKTIEQEQPGLNTKSTYTTRGETRTSNKHYRLDQAFDSNGSILGQQYFYVDSSNTNHYLLRLFPDSHSSDSSNSDYKTMLDIRVDSSGNTSAYLFSSPSSTDNSNSIATTSFVNTTLLTNIAPSYTSRISRSGSTTYTASTSGWLYIYGYNTSTVTINGVSFPVGGRTDNYESRDGNMFFIKKGIPYTTPALSGATYYFIPCEGEV